MSETTQAVGTDTVVSLREITAKTVWDICELRVAPNQENFVAPNAFSIAQAHFSDVAWFRAIYAGETPVGFIMLSDDAKKPEYYLWRLMIASEHQGKGFGRRAVLQLIDYVRTRPGATQLLVSYEPGEGSPRDFYRKLGFEETGEVDAGEIVMRLRLEKG
ncbi:MAG: GNAT family N-acetyltransferase [Ktedonobacteraceae bacterium]